MTVTDTTARVGRPVIAKPGLRRDDFVSEPENPPTEQVQQAIRLRRVRHIPSDSQPISQKNTQPSNTAEAKKRGRPPKPKNDQTTTANTSNNTKTSKKKSQIKTNKAKFVARK